MLDRSHALLLEGDLIREIPWLGNQDLALHILADTSSLELFINDGEYVMTVSVFTPPNATHIQLFAAQSRHWEPVIFWPLASAR